MEGIADDVDLLMEGGDAGFWQDRDAVFVSFAAADEDCAVIEVDIFDAEGEAFGDTESGAIEEGGDEVFRLGEEGEDFLDFAMGEDGREAFGCFGMGELADIADLDLEDLVIEECQRIERLVLVSRRDVKVFGEVREELSDFGGSHSTGMFQVVKDDEAFDPVGVGFDRIGAEVAEHGQVADLVEEFWFRFCRHFPPPYVQCFALAAGRWLRTKCFCIFQAGRPVNSNTV